MAWTHMSHSHNVTTALTECDFEFSCVKWTYKCSDVAGLLRTILLWKNIIPASEVKKSLTISCGLACHCREMFLVRTRVISSNPHTICTPYLNPPKIMEQALHILHRYTCFKAGCQRFDETWYQQQDEDTTELR